MESNFQFTYFAPDNKAHLFCCTTGKEIFHLIFPFGLQRTERRWETLFILDSPGPAVTKRNPGKGHEEKSGDQGARSFNLIISVVLTNHSNSIP